jgi:formylglycine-generating enzyme required for sulfatase activity
MIWLLIKEIHFVSGPPMPADEVQALLKSARVSDSKAEKPTPEQQAANSKAPVSASPDKNLTLGQDVTMSLKLIPAGKFFMGGKSKNSEVTISKPFYLAATEVTRQQFEAFVSQTGYQTDAEKRGWATYWDKPTKGNKQIPGRDWRNCGYQQDADHPVACVTWDDANEFCQWLAKKTGEPVRLPTEAEWEYACRAGTTTRYQWGNDPQGGKGWCNITDESLQQALQNAVPLGLTSDIAVCPWSDGYAFTSPSGQFNANVWGLFDMHGNLWEWCADRFQQDFYSSDNSIDPRGPNRGALRVIRGGCWGDQPGLCSSAARVGWEPTFADFGIGFRVCCGELAPVQPVPTGGKSGSADRLKQLKQLLDQGLINKEDYDRKMKEIVDSI